MLSHLPSDKFYETLTSLLIYGTLKERSAIIQNKEHSFLQLIPPINSSIGTVLPPPFNRHKFSIYLNYCALYQYSVDLYDDHLNRVFTYIHQPQLEQFI